MHSIYIQYTSHSQYQKRGSFSEHLGERGDFRVRKVQDTYVMLMS